MNITAIIIIAAIIFGYIFLILWTYRCPQCSRWCALNFDGYHDVCRFCAHIER
jgi:hypothetical protein